MGAIVEKSRETKILDEADVIVIGGGPAGIAAALASARTGAETILMDRFGALGGIQTHGNNPTFSMVDPELHGGIMQEIILRLKDDGALKNIDDIPGPKSHFKDAVIAAVGKDILPDRFVNTDVGSWGCWATSFDAEYYKFLLDAMMEEANVKLMYHVWAAGAVIEDGKLKGVIVEGPEGRRAVLGKVIVDTTGNGYFAWKSGAPVMGAEGYPAGDKKGRHSGMLDSFFIGNVNIPEFRAFKEQEGPEWAQMYCGRELIKREKERGAYIKGEAVILSEHFDVYNTGRIYVMQPIHGVAEGNTCWMTEEMTACEVDMRKQTWAVFHMLKENVPGFKNAYIEKTPTIPCAGNGHRIIGNHIITIGDMRAGRAFEDGVAISNMHPDLYEAVGRFAYETIPYDIPYRALVSNGFDNLLSAGGTVSCGGFAQSALKYCAPTICMGQAAGTAAGLSAKNNVAPTDLDVSFLQKTIQEQGGKTSVKHISEDILAPYKAIQKMGIVFQRQDIEKPSVSEEDLAMY